MLTRLLYASRATRTIDEPMIHEILEQSREGHLEFGITGVLCIDPAGGHFLQVLEGGRGVVNRLYANIVKDPRHADVELLHFEEIEERHFSGWRMGTVDLTKVNRSIILRFSETAALDPYSLTGASALALIDELTNTASFFSREGH